MDWITAVLTITYMQLIARKMWQGWLLGILVQGLWIYTTYVAHLYGFLALSFLLAAQFTIALLKWKKEDA